MQEEEQQQKEVNEQAESLRELLFEKLNCIYKNIIIILILYIELNTIFL